MRGMSCLRRRVASDHGFFTSCCILPWRATLSESVEYIPPNPVRAGWVNRPEEGAWSSVHDYTGAVNDAPVIHSVLSADRVLLSTDPRTAFEAM